MSNSPNDAATMETWYALEWKGNASGEWYEYHTQLTLEAARKLLNQSAASWLQSRIVRKTLTTEVVE